MGLKPRRLAFPEKTGSRGPLMEVRGPALDAVECIIEFQEVFV